MDGEVGVAIRAIMREESRTIGAGVDDTFLSCFVLGVGSSGAMV